MQERIAVIGLGYVGLPLSVALARKFDTIGFDIDPDRIDELRNGEDRTREVAPADLKASSLQLTADIGSLSGRTIYIVTVPTPIDDGNRPDFTAILRACELIGPILSPGSIVVFESTVYPGVTEEICGPALEKSSGLKCGVDFKLGYSPERINPGDRDHPLEKIIKVVAGQDDEALRRLSAVYGAIVEAGIHEAPSIRVAEAAKVIENTQRDVNIALMNEISKICELVGIRSSDVLAAAGTKWNFLKFQPGLVGGHCIGVDPYYLTHKAQSIGFHPEMILAGRRINDGMAGHVARDVIKAMIQRKLKMDGAKVLVMGFTFKENIPDTRNTKIAELVRDLSGFVDVVVYDPIADVEAAQEEYGVAIVPSLPKGRFEAIVLAVKHRPIVDLGRTRLMEMLWPGGLLYDVVGVLPPGDSDLTV